MEHYQIIRPSRSLSPYVKHYWFLKTDDLTPPVQRVVPTGNLSLTFNRGERMFSIPEGRQQPGAFISGQTTGFCDLRKGNDIDIVSITFQPHGARAFFALPLNELYGSTISFEDMGDPELIELQNCLMDASDALSCVRLIEAFLTRRLVGVDPYNFDRMDAVIRSVNAGQTAIRSLAEISCLSYKQFKRIFSEYIGANPKDFLRIVRFQKALYTLQMKPRTSLTELAHECGYYDQPHLINEFKTFSGYTPARYISAWEPFSDYFI